MTGSLIWKLGIQQTAKIAIQPVAQRQSQMQKNWETKPTYLIILILAQTKLKCLIIFIPALAKKLTKECVK